MRSKFPLTGMKEGDISRDPADIIKVTAGSEVGGQGETPNNYVHFKLATQTVNQFLGKHKSLQLTQNEVEFHLNNSYNY